MESIFISDFAEQLNAFVSALENEGEQIVSNSLVKSQFNALALIRQRIQNQGMKADGSSFGSYSTKEGYYSLSRARTKGVRGKGKGTNSNRFIYLKDGTKKERKSRYEERGYSGWRQTNDLQTGFVDLTFRSGNGLGLWDNTGITFIKNGNEYTVTIEPSTTEHTKQLEGLSKRYGTILMLSEQELDLLAITLINEFKNRFTILQ